nr:hypothetical protein BaRGS_009747 [Batillaria attramentaria]
MCCIVTHRVAFHARPSKTVSVGKSHRIPLENVMLNEGGAFNGSTGVFTVPVTGTYFLIATTGDGGKSDDDSGDMLLMRYRRVICKNGVNVCTPSGRKSSSKYQDGRFYLQLQNPEEGGEYSCILPSTDPATSCLPDGSPLEAAIVVDEIQVRLTLLEAENNDLKAENTDMKAAVKDLKAENTDLKAENTDMKAAVKDIKTENTDIKAAVKDIKTLVNNNTATLVNYGHPVIPDTVMLNEGGAYSGTTGRFTVPYTGTYFLIATAANVHGHMNMMADNQWLCYADMVNLPVMGGIHGELGSGAILIMHDDGDEDDGPTYLFAPLEHYLQHS